MNPDRRWFLSGAVGIAVAHGLLNGSAPGFTVLTDATQAPAISSAVRVGSAFLRIRPWESGREKLLALLRQGLLTVNEMQHSEQSGDWNAGQLRELIASDFSFGRVVALDGWIVSETECRLCALTATEIKAG